MKRIFKAAVSVGFLSFLLFPFAKIHAASTDPSLKEVKEIVSNLQSCNVILSQDLEEMAKKVDFSSFLGKTVKIPIDSHGKSIIPGGDTDYLYISPPKFFKDKKTGKSFWYPITSCFFADGKTITKEKEDIVKSQVEKEISKAFEGKRYMLDQLKNIVIKQMGMKITLPKKQTNAGKTLWDFFFNQVNAVENNSIDDTIITNDSSITSSDLNTNINASELASQLGLDTSNGTDLTQMFDMNDSRTQQLFMLLLMNFVMSQKAAEASNTDKATCLSAGGQWINETCVIETAGNCAAGEIDFSQNNIGDGDCHAVSDLKSTCVDSGGTWNQKTITDPNNDSSGDGSLFCKSQDKMTYRTDLTSVNTNDNVSQKKYTCTCGDGYCGDSTGKCISADESAGDTDKDGVENGKDKCPKTASGESVNEDESSSDYGCSCTDLQKKGRLQSTTCPPSECRGQYWIQYPSQVDPSSLCSDGFIQDPSTLCTPTQTMTQQCVDMNNQQNNSNQNSNSDLMKQLKDMMDKMNQQKGGSSGGGSSGGGSGGGCGGGQQQQPGNQDTGPSDKKPSTTPAAANTQLKETLNTAVSDLGDKTTPEQRQSLYQQIDKITSNTGTDPYQQLQQFNQAVEASGMPSEQRAQLYAASTHEALNTAIANSGLTSEERAQMYKATEANKGLGAAEQQQRFNEALSNMRDSAQNPEGVSAPVASDLYNAADRAINPSNPTSTATNWSQENLAQAKQDLADMKANGASPEAIKAQEQGIANMENNIPTGSTGTGGTDNQYGQTPAVDLYPAQTDQGLNNSLDSARNLNTYADSLESQASQAEAAGNAQEAANLRSQANDARDMASGIVEATNTGTNPSTGQGFSDLQFNSNNLGESNVAIQDNYGQAVNALENGDYNSAASAINNYNSLSGNDNIPNVSGSDIQTMSQIADSMGGMNLSADAVSAIAELAAIQGLSVEEFMKQFPDATKDAIDDNSTDESNDGSGGDPGGGSGSGAP